jgi:hypothetical protein
MIKAPSEIRCSEIPRYSSATERHREHQRNRQGHHQPGAPSRNLRSRARREDPPIEKGTIDLAILSQALPSERSRARTAF